MTPLLRARQKTCTVCDDPVDVAYMSQYNHHVNAHVIFHSKTCFEYYNLNYAGYLKSLAMKEVIKTSASNQTILDLMKALPHLQEYINSEKSDKKRFKSISTVWEGYDG